MKKMNKKGFTIVELVIVITVIAILSAVLVPTFAGVISNSKDSAAAQEAKAAYTQYLTDEDNAEDPAENFIYNYGEKRVVVIKAGNLVEENGEVKMFESVEAAKTILGCTEASGEGENATPANYETETISDNFTAYIIK